MDIAIEAVRSLCVRSCAKAGAAEAQAAAMAKAARRSGDDDMAYSPSICGDGFGNKRNPDWAAAKSGLFARFPFSLRPRGWSEFLALRDGKRAAGPYRELIGIVVKPLRQAPIGQRSAADAAFA